MKKISAVTATKAVVIKMKGSERTSYCQEIINSKNEIFL